MSRRVKEAVKAKTGCPTRMKSLPHADISSYEHHHHNHNKGGRGGWFTANQYSSDPLSLDEESHKRKCVYTYEDKYSFARILVNDSLIFDSHFESGNLHSAFRYYF